MNIEMHEYILLWLYMTFVNHKNAKAASYIGDANMT